MPFLPIPAVWQTPTAAVIYRTHVKKATPPFSSTGPLQITRVMPLPPPSRVPAISTKFYRTICLFQVSANRFLQVQQKNLLLPVHHQHSQCILMFKGPNPLLPLVFIVQSSQTLPPNSPQHGAGLDIPDGRWVLVATQRSGYHEAQFIPKGFY